MLTVISNFAESNITQIGFYIYHTCQLKCNAALKIVVYGNFETILQKKNVYEPFLSPEVPKKMINYAILSLPMLLSLIKEKDDIIWTL